MANECCCLWWNRLTEKQREYIHYMFYDINNKGNPLSSMSDEDVHSMHES